jgi:ArsR family transcriptional regulator
MNRSGSFTVELAVTPRFDLFYALYTLTSSASSALDPWKEKALGRLPRDFERVAKRVAPLPIFWPLLADAIQNVPGAVAFDEILSTIREIPVEDLQKKLLSGIFHESEIVDALLAHRKNLGQVLASDSVAGGDLARHFGLLPYNQNSSSATTIAALLSRPKSFRDELALVLQRFWQTGFRRDWRALEPRLRDESSRMRDLRDERSTADIGRELNLPVVMDDRAREIRPRSGSAISYDRVDTCYLIPSAFNTRRWWAKYEKGSERVTLYFPITSDFLLANTVLEESFQDRERATTQRRSINAESVFRALGDTTRYAIASILARTPTSSADLARSLNVSKPTITHHVQALRSAGLISETPSHGSTKLSLSRDTVEELSGAAVEQLFSSSGDLTLVTTRKRRKG